jgi:hypothetical protein
MTTTSSANGGLCKNEHDNADDDAFSSIDADIISGEDGGVCIACGVKFTSEEMDDIERSLNNGEL